MESVKNGTDQSGCSFEPVELEGTTVSRASVHNISIMEELELGVGDTIQVYKANMIIPQIAENLTRSGVKIFRQSVRSVVVRQRFPWKMRQRRYSARTRNVRRST